MMAWNTIVTDLSTLMTVPAEAAEKVSALAKKVSRQEEEKNSTLKLVLRCAAAVAVVAITAAAVVCIVKAVRDIVECAEGLDDFDEDAFDEDALAPDGDEDDDDDDSDDDDDDEAEG